MPTQTPILILGAGPAGAATALKLSYLDIPCVLIDKAGFPRDKVCGDALSGKVPTLLNRLDPASWTASANAFNPVDVWGIRFYSPSNKLIELPFNIGYERVPDQAPGYVSKRMSFDTFLVDEVKRRDNIDLRLNTEISKWEKTDTGTGSRPRTEGSNGIAAYSSTVAVLTPGSAVKKPGRRLSINTTPPPFGLTLKG